MDKSKIGISEDIKPELIISFPPEEAEVGVTGRLFGLWNRKSLRNWSQRHKERSEQFIGLGIYRKQGQQDWILFSGYCSFCRFTSLNLRPLRHI